jgi:hypothetical protein
MVPYKFGPSISRSPQPVPLEKENILRTICLEGSNWLGTICPREQNFWAPSVHGDQIGWVLFVQRDQSIGDPLRGTNVRVQYAFGTKCVTVPECLDSTGSDSAGPDCEFIHL